MPHTSIVPLFSPRIDLAIRIASVGHALDVRKGTSLPYIAHPVSVARLLERDGWPEDVVIAGYLHDVLEDLEPDDERVRARFREEFAPLASAPEEGRGFREAVRAFIADAFGAGGHPARRGRHRGEGRRVRRATRVDRPQARGRRAPGARRRARRRAEGGRCRAQRAVDPRGPRRRGPRVLGRFNATPDQALWYYQSVSVAVARRLAGRTTQLPALLAESVEELARRVG